MSALTPPRLLLPGEITMRMPCPLLCCLQLPPLARCGPGRPRGGRQLARLAQGRTARRHLPRNGPPERLAGRKDPSGPGRPRESARGFSGPAVVGNVLYTMGNVKADRRGEGPGIRLRAGCEQGRPAVVGVAHRSGSARRRRLSRATPTPRSTASASIRWASTATWSAWTSANGRTI